MYVLYVIHKTNVPIYYLMSYLISLGFSLLPYKMRSIKNTYLTEFLQGTMPNPRVSTEKSQLLSYAHTVILFLNIFY